MNAKRLVLFGSVAVIVAGGLIYSLGIYPPASSRDGQGAIGERQVYRAEQPADASVTPGAAPVAMKASAEATKNGHTIQVKGGQVFQLTSGEFARLQGGQVVQLNNGQVLQVQNGAMYQVQDGQM